MNDKPIVYMISGQVGSGKTTFAKKLEQKTNAIRFTPDEWMIDLFEKLPPNEDFDEYYFRCCNIAWKTAKEILNRNISVILDFGFWKKSERNKYKKVISGLDYRYKLFYIKCETEIIKKRLIKRNIEESKGTIKIDEAAFDFFAPQFEPPSADENAETVYS